MKVGVKYARNQPKFRRALGILQGKFQKRENLFAHSGIIVQEPPLRDRKQMVEIIL